MKTPAMALTCIRAALLVASVLIVIAREPLAQTARSPEHLLSATPAPCPEDQPCTPVTAPPGHDSRCYSGTCRANVCVPTTPKSGSCGPDSPDPTSECTYLVYSCENGRCVSAPHFYAPGTACNTLSNGLPALIGRCLRSPVCDGAGHCIQETIAPCCGNRIIEEPFEECDLTTLPPDAPKGSVCRGDCTLSIRPPPPTATPNTRTATPTVPPTTPQPTPPPSCGDGVVDPGEDCDGGAPEGCEEACTCSAKCVLDCPDTCDNTAACGYDAENDSVTLTVGWGQFNPSGEYPEGQPGCCPPSGLSVSSAGCPPEGGNVTFNLSSACNGGSAGSVSCPCPPRTPTPAPTPEPTEPPVSSSSESSSEPTSESSSDPSSESSSEKSSEESSEESSESSTEPPTESSAESTDESSVESSNEESSESSAEPPTESSAESADESSVESSNEESSESSAEPPTESSAESADESSVDSSDESSVEPSSEGEDNSSSAPGSDTDYETSSDVSESE